MRSSGYAREANDWYQEPRWCVDALLAAEGFTGTVWDPACGAGNIPESCRAAGLDAHGSDIVDRGYGVPGINFLDPDIVHSATSIISNPPFKNMQRWADLALSRTTDRVALLGRLAFLEGQTRAVWFEGVPLYRVYVLSKRISMPPGGSGVPAKGGSVAFAWHVFKHGFQGDATIHRLLPIGAAADARAPGVRSGEVATSVLWGVAAILDVSSLNFPRGPVTAPGDFFDCEANYG